MNLDPDSFLAQIIEKKKKEILVLESRGVIDSLSEYRDFSFENYSLYNALFQTKKLSLIAELKKASPSKGLINADFDVDRLAKNYCDLGASAFSVLTEKYFFLGDPSYILQVKERQSLPILRKDFIIHSLQVYESKLLGADAILLILDILDLSQAQELIMLAKSLNLDVLVEIHSEDALDKLRELKNVNIVGINNRDLKTFKVDLNTGYKRLETLKSFMPAETAFVAESGFTTADEMNQLYQAGFHAVLIGEGLVTHPNLSNYFASR